MKRNIYILYLIVLAVIILSTLLWAKFNKIGQIETKQPYYNITNKNDSIFDIYFIGDSWANRSNKYCFNQTLDSLLKSKKIASQTCSYGFDGYTSNEIYKKL